MFCLQLGVHPRMCMHIRVHCVLYRNKLSGLNTAPLVFAVLVYAWDVAENGSLVLASSCCTLPHIGQSCIRIVLGCHVCSAQPVHLTLICTRPARLRRPVIPSTSYRGASLSKMRTSSLVGSHSISRFRSLPVLPLVELVLNVSVS